jgi:hypothetical protein
MSERKSLASWPGVAFALFVFSSSMMTIALQEHYAANKAKADLERFKEEACIMGCANNRYNIHGQKVFTWGH